MSFRISKRSEINETRTHTLTVKHSQSLYDKNLIKIFISLHVLHSISNVCFGHVYDDGINTNKRSSVVPSLINSIRWVSRTSHPHIYIESQTLYKVHAVNIYTRKKRRRRATILCAGCGSLQFVLTKRNGSFWAQKTGRVILFQNCYRE